MRFKTLLGLLAIGGAVAYAQKKRGADLSLHGIANTLRGVLDTMMGKATEHAGRAPNIGTSTEIAAGTSSGLGTDASTSTSGSYSSSYGPNGVDHK